MCCMHVATRSSYSVCMCFCHIALECVCMYTLGFANTDTAFRLQQFSNKLTFLLLSASFFKMVCVMYCTIYNYLLEIIIVNV